MALHIKKDDIVEVISGSRKGLRGKVLRVLPSRSLVIVEGVNMVKRHVRPSRRNPQGGRMEKEAPIHISNVLPVDPRIDGSSRVHFEVQTDARGQVTAKRRLTQGNTVLGELTRVRGRN